MSSSVSGGRSGGETREDSLGISPRARIRSTVADGVHPVHRNAAADRPDSRATEQRCGGRAVPAPHCLGKLPVADVVYAPYFRNGTTPFGTYAVTGQVFSPGWFPGGRIDRDFAFLTVAGNVQRRAGAEKIGYSSPVPARVTVEGYSLNGGPVVCTRKAATIETRGQRQLRFTCGGFDNGSSGAPFLTGISRKSGLGTIVGVIGGYQQGGSTSAVSYSSAFGRDIHAVYQELR